jgi:ketosteroid isomerase-like protein
MYKTLVRAKLRRLFAGASQGNWRPIVDGFDADFSYRFAGNTPLGGTRTTRAAMEAWWSRVLRLFPGARFTPQEIVVEGSPWNTRVMTHILFQATLPKSLGAAAVPYENEFMQLMRLRWGRITSIVTIEDTQRFVEVLPRLAEAGLTDATAPPIDDDRDVARAGSATSVVRA